MGLFDLFKKKPQPQTVSQVNELELSLQKAAAEPAHRPAFYHQLLSGKLIVLTASTSIPDGEQVLKEDTAVNIFALEDGRIPVFTSTDRIFDKGIIKEQVNFLEMKGEDLFNLATGASFILNPYSDHSKDLLAEEVESMLNGTIFTGNHKKVTVEQDTKVQIGQPAEYPTAIVHSLKILFAGKPAVKAAYLGWIYNPASGDPPHLIFALDMEGEHQDIINEAGFTVQQLSKPNEIFDFIMIDNSGLSGYFLHETTAFYKR